MITSEHLYNRIRKLCVENDMSLNDLATKCGRSVNFFYVLKNKNGGTNTLEFWKNVASEFGLTIDDLIEE